MKKLILVLAAHLIFFFNSSAQTQIKNKQLAVNAINAWQKGEDGEGYETFTAMLDSSHFQYFSHPFTGYNKGAEGFTTLQVLIKNRTQNPNHLKFSEQEFFVNGDKVVILFRSTGNAGKIKYDGPVCIQFEFRKNKIVGFKEYLGLLNPEWFK